MISTQAQPNSGRRSKVQRGFALSVLTTLMLVTTLSSTARADAVTHWNEIAMAVTTPPGVESRIPLPVAYLRYDSRGDS
jgi:hypothetical protein